MICFSRTALDKRKLDELKVDPATLKDDGADYAGKTVEKPWGEERELRRTAEYSMWRLVLNVGEETSMHCHTMKTTLLEVQSGEVILLTFSGERRLVQGDCVLIDCGVFHRSRAPAGAVIIETEWPPNRCDLVRLADKYGRRGNDYARR